MNTYLVILEVSQKQAYIFSSNKLRDNVRNSAVIAYVTSSEYFASCAPDLYQENENEVYCGGGHSILQFKTKEAATEFIRKITLDMKRRFPGIELFATIYNCDSEPSAENISDLIQSLEKKKAIRRASFSQRTFGVEKIDPLTRDVEILSINGEPYKKFIPDDRADREAYPKGYARAVAFEDLGGSKGDTNFISVVHIDGNAMGKRVENLRRNYGALEPWDKYRKILKEFSDSIDEDYKSTFKEMCEVVSQNIVDGKLGSITLKNSDSGNLYFPVRRIITEGDDVCFVTDGRIGIECARIFLEALGKKKNKADGKPYVACAGVAIVHQKYPFYMAYELAEELCSNAKKFVANSTKQSSDVDPSEVCALDWHIEFGELGNGIEEIRRQYVTEDQKKMVLRPYVISGPKPYVEMEQARNYRNYKKVFEQISRDGAYAIGKIKGLRPYIREGEVASWNYLKANLIEHIALNCYTGIFKELDVNRVGTGEAQERALFIQTADGDFCSILFDAIEAMDTFIPLNN